MKLSATVLSQQLADAISNSNLKGVFPDNAKFTSVSFVGKQSNDQNKSSNFSPVVTLNIVPKIYEPIIKNQLILILNNTFSPYIAAYRESYTTQHVLTCTNQIT